MNNHARYLNIIPTVSLFDLGITIEALQGVPQHLEFIIYGLYEGHVPEAVQ